MGTYTTRGQQQSWTRRAKPRPTIIESDDPEVIGILVQMDAADYRVIQHVIGDFNVIEITNGKEMLLHVQDEDDPDIDVLVTTLFKSHCEAMAASVLTGV